MRSKIAGFVAGVLGAVALILASCNGELAMSPALGATGTVHLETYGPNHTQPMAVPKWMTRPCAEEDSVNCYWDAQAMGNGHGHSFYIRRMPGDITGLTCIVYVKPRDARRWDHCYLPER